MITENDELFELIGSLSKNEKGYFKKYASRSSAGQDNNYIRLFNALESMESYEDKKFRKKHRAEKFIRFLASEKNYLYRMIVRSLNEYHHASSVDAQLQEYL
ncbi:MAG: hypothetical protein ACJ76F_06590, partial [Bacteroidia bacterium]